MSQASSVIPDGNGESVLAAINGALGAINSLYYGPTDPFTTGQAIAEMWWADSGNSLIKQRNAANTAWVAKGTLLSDGTIQWYSPLALPLTGGTLTGALYQPAPVTLTSALGIITLPGTSNVFNVSGTENVTSFAGWATGRFSVIWASPRILVNSSSILMATGANRIVSAGDISEFQVTATGIVQELNYFAASPTASAWSLAGIANYLVNGGRHFALLSGLQLNIASGTDYINGQTINFIAGSITLPARMASLIVDSYTGLTSAISAALPAIDNYTVARWIFNQTGAGAAIPNSAVGVSSIAVANSLTASGGLTSVDGWLDYAIQGDGSTGYYIGANSTGFPVGAATRNLRVLWTCRSITEDGIISGYGSGTTQFLVFNYGGTLYFADGYEQLSMGFSFTVGQTYIIEMGYDGTNIICLVNGKQVCKTAYTAATTAGVIYALRYISGNYSNGILHFIDLRTQVPTEATSGPIVNRLMFPCRYTGYSGSYPTIETADLATYHEWRFAESSGQTVADTQTSSPLTGTVTGTNIVSSDIITGAKARSFNGTSDKVILGNIAFPTAFSIIGVINAKSNSGYQPVFGNFNGSTAGMIFETSQNGNGLLSAYSVGSSYVGSSSQFPIGTPTFFAIVVGGGYITFYINSPYPDVVKTFIVDSTSQAGWIASYATYFFGGTMDCIDYIPRSLSQAEIAQYYNALMAQKEKTIIDDVVPANSLAIGFVTTGSTAINNFVDSSNPQGSMPDYAYGIRVGLQSFSNKRKFLGWKYFNGSTVLTWNNPFGTRRIKTYYTWAQDANGTNESDLIGVFVSSTNYGIESQNTSSQRISILAEPSSVVSFNGAGLTSGYIGCYAEVALEILGE